MTSTEKIAAQRSEEGKTFVAEKMILAVSSFHVLGNWFMAVVKRRHHAVPLLMLYFEVLESSANLVHLLVRMTLSGGAHDMPCHMVGLVCGAEK